MAVRPSKCKTFLDKNGEKFGWLQNRVCLAGNLLVGPFELVKRFKPRSSRKVECYRVEEEVWDRLEIVGQTYGLNMKEIHTQERVHTATINIDTRPEAPEPNDGEPKSK